MRFDDYDPDAIRERPDHMRVVAAIVILAVILTVIAWVSLIF